jgi:hypothetical protein
MFKAFSEPARLFFRRISEKVEEFLHVFIGIALNPGKLLKNVSLFPRVSNHL